MGLGLPGCIATIGLGAALFAAFLLAERRAAEPVLPPWVVSRRLLLSTTLVSFGVGAIILGLTSYVPTFLEGADSAPPVVAGLALAALTIGWPISASQSGRLYLRIGFRRTALIGIVIAVGGTSALVAAAHTHSVLLVAASCFTIGLGMGLTASPTLIAAQSSVEWNERGVVTGTNLFARSIGSALGVAVFGAIANAVYATHPTAARAEAIVDASAAVFVSVLIGPRSRSWRSSRCRPTASAPRAVRRWRQRARRRPTSPDERSPRRPHSDGRG
ncbi:hypothetical protein GCM10027449_29760 [Sinomonas notoginsengisoli]